VAALLAIRYDTLQHAATRCDISHCTDRTSTTWSPPAIGSFSFSI